MVLCFDLFDFQEITCSSDCCTEDYSSIGLVICPSADPKTTPHVQKYRSKIKKGRDGFSVEKSIQFLNAYENVEKKTFQYEYLKTLNLESQSKEIEIKDGILYDVHLTKRGKIWFEVGPMEQASKEQSNFLK